MGWFAKIAAALLLLSLGGHAHASPGKMPDEEEVLRKCIRAAAGGSLWLERTLWGLHDQEGGEVGTVSLNRNGSEDLGPMQINSWWIGPISAALKQDRLRIRKWLVHDPCFNVQAARWIFVQAIAETSSYWEAVGAYHSPQAERRRHYAQLVAARLRARFGADIFGHR